MILFTCLVIALSVRILAFAIKAAWGLGKLLFGVLLFPLGLFFLALKGFLVLAVILAVLGGIGCALAR